MPDSITAINTVRDVLRDDLADPYSLIAGGETRPGNMWVFANEPNVAAKYPQIQLLKLDNPRNILNIGSNYTDQELLVVNIWFSAKNGFKVTVSNVEYKNAQLVEYYLGQISKTLKLDFEKSNSASTIKAASIPAYRTLNSSPVEYDSEHQLYFGSVTIRIYYFTNP